MSDPGLFNDPYLLPHHGIISSRLAYIREVEKRLTCNHYGSLAGFSDYHLVFGLHQTGHEWVFREWAPAATSVHIIGDMTRWQLLDGFSLTKTNDPGVWEGRFPRGHFNHGDHYRLRIAWEKGQGDRIPTAAARVVQDPKTLIFNAQVWESLKPHVWKQSPFIPRDEPPLIYEAHVGMALEEGRVGSYKEFQLNVLPIVKQAGYNTIQLMAIQEHPYYASFGYHVSSFFAPSSRFGTPEELKSLIDEAHKLGIRVLMDLVHSHTVSNEVEGLSRFDGSTYQFFYPGERGYHRLWDSRCFDYSKTMVLKFLLSNCRYWLEEYNLDGFRFDGVTSMIFKDHGINRAFTCYGDYYNDSVDVDALAYLCLANRLIHDLAPAAVTIAEEVSGYPGIAAPVSKGGTGFDFRYAMGVPDFWIKLLKEYTDETWPMEMLWSELNARREGEKSISYAESHDQALVGDQTLMMRLMGREIYFSMKAGPEITVTTFRGIALHKMIRLITIATAGDGYLNFMGNEFGHPDWIDFPSQRNHWSYHYARRQWSLKDNPDLFFSVLGRFDRAMIGFIKGYKLLESDRATLVHLHQEDRVMVFLRQGLLFVFNFHDSKSYSDYGVEAPPGKYCMVLNSDAAKFGGKERLHPDQIHFTLNDQDKTNPKNRLSLYLPTRSAFVLSLFENAVL